MHLLVLSLLSKDVQRKPSCQFHDFKHDNIQTTIGLVCGVDSFCEKHGRSFPHCEALAPLHPRISPSSRKSIDGACWLGPLVGLNCW